MRRKISTDPIAPQPQKRSQAEGGDDETMGILGQAYLAAGEKEAAFGVFNQAHEFDPSDSEWLHRMVALDPERAARDFARKIEDSPGTSNDELLGTYGLALERQGKLGDAYDEYLRAWRLDDEDWEWMRGMARTNPERAAALLEETYKENPEDGTVAGALADAYAGQRRTTEAVRLYEQAIDAGEDVHRWMAALASVEPARGLPMLKAAVEEDSEDDEMWGALGDAYYNLGRMEEAKEAYDRALDIDPSDWEWSVQRARIP
jgi:tetratricopeptide (TPR) repeat protein